ncbi:MAG: hypothetical protein U0L52_01935 [Bacteroidaceae bacterium]|nr:hypothetical protein [Bacteroidaceae bacterium]
MAADGLKPVNRPHSRIEHAQGGAESLSEPVRKEVRMKKEKWSGVRIDPEHIKKVKHEKMVEIKAEILMFTIFLIFAAMIIAFLLEITR